MVTHYTSDSRGPIPIADMEYRHLKNSAVKLWKALGQNEAHERAPEYHAMAARINDLEKEFARADALAKRDAGA